MTDLALKFRRAFAWIVILGLASVSAAQIPTSFQDPVLGYLFDVRSWAVRPIIGIAGSSRIEAPLPLAFAIEKIVFSADQRNAIVASPDHPEVLVLDLRRSRTLPIRGAPSSVSKMQGTPGGSAAALHYAADRKILLVSGIPDDPVVRATIDVSFVNDPLTLFAVSENGTSALLVFSSGEQESLYSWTDSSGPRYVSRALHISDMAFLGDEAVIVDSGANQAFLIRNLREQPAPTLIADAGDGLLDPAAVFVSSRHEIYVGNSGGGILIMNSLGHILRRTSCKCKITTMEPLANSALRLTDRLDQPISILDGSEADQTLFIPALAGYEPQ